MKTEVSKHETGSGKGGVVYQCLTKGIPGQSIETIQPVWQTMHHLSHVPVHHRDAELPVHGRLHGYRLVHSDILVVAPLGCQGVDRLDRGTTGARAGNGGTTLPENGSTS